MILDWFARQLLDWFEQHGRKDLPWQQPASPYRVWVSEIMLQQTQVVTVIPFYQRFMQRFPDVATLAAADLDSVLHHWTGLGYYARARNLHAAARQIMTRHDGTFPSTVDQLQALPGIGLSTAGAIAAIAFGLRAPILDGNVKRVLTRFHAIEGHPGTTTVARELWQLADMHTPAVRVADYTQAIMDLGATLCTRARPRCDACPMVSRCAGHAGGSPTRYPTPRNRKAIPVRTARLFLLVDAEGRCLLEQRPPTGLWGGLWTPPQRETDSDPDQVCAELGLARVPLTDASVDPVFRHTFTHFHLDIETVRVHVSSTAADRVAEAPAICWYDPAEPPAIGLSAPASRLLQSLQPTPRRQNERETDT